LFNEDVTPPRQALRLRRGLALLGLMLISIAAVGQSSIDSGAQSSQTGPVVLRQSAAGADSESSRIGERDGSRPTDRRDILEQRDRRDGLDIRDRTSDRSRTVRIGPDGQILPPRKRPGEEFDAFVQRLAEPVEVRRFGADMMTDTERSDAAEASPSVPADYLVSPGDELAVTLWGSVVADLRLTVDRSGRIAIPRVGPVLVAGVRYADLDDTVRKRVAQVFRNFDLSVSLGRLRGKRVYITGFVERPGAYNVGGLATITHALLKAGGPSPAGSFRQIRLRRAGQTMVEFDLYELLLRGERAADRVVQGDDVIHVGPLGAQVALIGSVNNPAIFELKPGETVADLLRMAGGFTPVADRSRLAIERLDDRSSVRIAQLSLPADASATLSNGDVLRAFSAVDTALPVERQNKRVRVEGEVVRPGEYVLPPASTVTDALKAAGGLTPAAFVFGTEFSRESVRTTQQENYERALRDLETEFTRASTTQRTSTAEEAAAQAARSTATERLVQRLRTIRPTGRVVLQLPPDAQALPDLALEDGDRLYIPPRATSVGVFGSVFNGGSYLFSVGRSVDDYLKLAGGPTKGADASSTFVVRANGSVVSSRQRGSWFGGRELTDVAALPGDTIFVPEEVNKTTWVQDAKDWTQILYQFGVGLAAATAFR
jgi:protein involved in polysaccharide export with SLBB domain